MIYCPQFWGIRATWMARKTRYMFEIYDQKLVVFVFDDRFWRPREIYNDHKTTTKNSLFSRFIAVFMSYCPQFWGTAAIYNDRKTQYMFDSYDQKLVVFAFYHCFHELFPSI